MCPNEANPPLLIDTDAVLSFAIIFQRFKSIAGWHLQIVKNHRPVQLREFSQSRSLDVHPAFYTLPLKKSLGIFAFEVSYRHGEQ